MSDRLLLYLLMFFVIIGGFILFYFVYPNFLKKSEEEKDFLPSFEEKTPQNRDKTESTVIKTKESQPIVQLSKKDGKDFPSTRFCTRNIDLLPMGASFEDFKRALIKDLKRDRYHIRLLSLIDKAKHVNGVENVVHKYRDLASFIRGNRRIESFSNKLVVTEELRKQLKIISVTYNIPLKVILSLLRKSSFRMKKNIFDFLVTALYYDPYNVFFRKSLGEAFMVVSETPSVSDKLYINDNNFLMGMINFSVLEYLNFGVDKNKDGFVDIWNSPVEAAASLAKYFSKSGWINVSKNRNTFFWGERVFPSEYKMLVIDHLVKIKHKCLSDNHSLYFSRDKGEPNYPEKVDNYPYLLVIENFLGNKDYYLVNNNFIVFVKYYCSSSTALKKVKSL